MDELLEKLGCERNISVIPVSGAWYGFDPIHLKRRARGRVWPEVLASWNADCAERLAAQPSLWMRAYLNCLAPHERWVFGVNRRVAQPCGRLVDGTTISLY
jgi:hypothetical protein